MNLSLSVTVSDGRTTQITGGDAHGRSGGCLVEGSDMGGGGGSFGISILYFLTSECCLGLIYSARITRDLSGGN